jgi:hypothetical protein|uniref:Dirigent protein n=1 Tax=Picea sitchensis TaxID=3332 RepID=A6YQZ9_PICSI|nr:dirigent-like protein [Picea sitchensis]
MAAPQSSNLSLLAVIILLVGGTHHAVGMELKKTEIEFYMHDVVKAMKNITTMKVTHGPHGFGMIRVIDNVLTEGLQQNSKELGRARGMYVQDSLSGANLLMVLTVIFQAGEHSGSTLCLQGQDDTKQREISVVGGTGHFRHATGHAILETQLSMGANSILNFNITVLH